MSTSTITVSGAGIAQDAAGRYSLNQLHRASGNEKRHQPSDWLRTDSAKALIAALEADPGNPGSVPPVSVVRGGPGQGTFVCRELVLAYAMWVSPAFHLAVLRAYDALANPTPQHVVPQTLSDALRLAADLADRNAMLEQQRNALAIDASAFRRIADADGLCCISSAAKALQMGPNELFKRLSVERWIFRRVSGANWTAHQRVIDAGLMAHKLAPMADGRQVSQAMLTAKGMARLATLLEAEKVAA